jgi:hypothetical protein
MTRSLLSLIVASAAITASQAFSPSIPVRPSRPLRMAVLDVDSEAEFDKKISSAGDALVIIDYSTTWCGPVSNLRTYSVRICQYGLHRLLIQTKSRFYIAIINHLYQCKVSRYKYRFGRRGGFVVVCLPIVVSVLTNQCNISNFFALVYLALLEHLI